MPKPRKKPGPREERLVITGDPELALRRLLHAPFTAPPYTDEAIEAFVRHVETGNVQRRWVHAIGGSVVGRQVGDRFEQLDDDLMHALGPRREDGVLRQGLVHWGPFGDGYEPVRVELTDRGREWLAGRRR